MKHKLIALLMGFCLLLTITGCSGQDTEKPAAPDIQEEASDEDLLSDMVKIWGTITSVDDSGITVDNQSGNSSSGEMILVVDPSQNTIIDAVTGFPAALDEIRTGSFEAYLGPAMTMSLPPQANPYMVIVNIPEDTQAPQYITAAEEPVKDNGILTVRASDGSFWQIPEDAEIIPFLTKNIVTPDDITKGSKCLIWQNAEGTVEKVVLFQ